VRLQPPGDELADSDRVGRMGPGEALAHVAAEVAQPARLLVGLDAFGDDGDAHAVGE